MQAAESQRLWSSSPHCCALPTFLPGLRKNLLLAFHCKTKMQLKWNGLLCHSQSDKTTAQGQLFSPIKHMCVGSVWQDIWQETPSPLIHPQGRYMAAIHCFLYASCLAKHLEPMSRAGLAKCHTAFFKRTVEHALMPNPQQKKKNELQRN